MVSLQPTRAEEMQKIEFIKSQLEEAAHMLGFFNQKNLMLITKDLCERYDDETIAKTIIYIREKWTNRHFPMWPEIRMLANKMRKAAKEYPEWVILYSRVLDIQPWQLPRYHDLTEKQKAKLSVLGDKRPLSSEETSKLFKKTKDNSRAVLDKMNKYLTGRSSNRGGGFKTLCE